MKPNDPVDEKSRRFADAASGRRQSTFVELIAFLRQNAKWWLTPIVVLLLLVGALVILSTTAAAPFIYTFF